MTDKTKIIRGAGGPPKPPPKPYRAPDTLHSRSFATVQDLISEGEIEGFASASKEERSKGVGFIATGAAPNALMAAIGNIGIGLTLMGVSEMLFPLPEPQKFNSEEDPQLSFNFSGVQNTSRAGTPVPIVYGEIITGSVVISAAIDTNQVEA